MNGKIKLKQLIIAEASKQKIANEFNRKAEKLGCRARIGGNGKSPVFYEFRNGIDSQGYEIWYKCDAQKFGQLIAKYPDLQD